ncbi:MAG TPA: mannose-1-phosphate guanylyltransferase [Bacteroidales bacterium]|nr:mannose-1-phosphate guanylyltransferase [Bacteroidales bacterium]
MTENNYCVIMAGGVGTRFWPMSRTAKPKQFIDILGTGESLIQQTYKRFRKIFPAKNIFIVTNIAYKELVKQQINEIDDSRIICETARRNTAPCIALASYKIASLCPNANTVVAPSDHIILNDNIFIEIINSALKIVSKNDCLLTLGINPTRPDTGYGYIQFNENTCSPEDNRVFKVKTFTEKPALEMAKSFINSGDFLWNSGIFIWSLQSILKAFDKYLPEINELFKEGENFYNTPLEEDFIKKTYTVCKSISVDYGIMEKADNVYVLRSNFGWSDLGTWGSLYEINKKDENGNSIVGKNVMMYDSKGCIVNIKDKLAVIQGLEDYIIIEADNILLICKKSEEQKIRKFVNDVLVEKGEQYT